MRRPLITLATFIAYLATAKIGSMIHAVVGYNPTIWPPAGIAVAGILFGHNLTAIAIFAAATIVNRNLDLSWSVSALAATGSALSAWLAAFAIKRKIDFDWSFGRPKDVIYFFATAVVASTSVSAAICTIALTSAQVVQFHDIYKFFYSFWVGDALGILMVVPVAMIWSSIPARVTVLNRWWEFLALISIAMAIGTFLFIDFEAVKELNQFIYRRVYIIFPILIWAALRFGPLGLSTVMLIASAFASYGATHEVLLLHSKEIPEGLFTAQIFIGTSSISGLILAAVVRNIRLKEEKFRSMFEGSDVPMAEADIRGQFILVNDRFCALTGYSREELLNKTFPDLTHPDDIAHEATLFIKLISKESPVLKVEKRYLTKSGDIIWISVDATLINHGPGREPTSIAVVQDITQRKVAEISAQEAKAMANEANQAKSDFLAAMSHEIRTPLGVILGFAELLQDQHLDEKLRREFAQTIRRNSIELGTLIDDILDLSKIEAGHLDISSAKVMVESICKDISESFAPIANKKGIEIHWQVDPNVPNSIETDGKRLRQILINLVGNAIKFTDKGVININVSMRSTSDSNELLILVSDTGCGISKDDIPSLFQPFRQAKQARDRHIGGTGLGLVLSRRLAQLLGGNVQLKETKIGGGSTFEVSLHIDQQKTSPNENAQHQTIEATESMDENNLNKLRILIAEDTPDQATLIKLLLTDLGAEVDIAENGEEAVKKATLGNYALVLMDMQMPLMNGYEATSQLRQLGFNKPILALTAQAMQTDQTRCKVSGCNGHLSKPFTQEMLVTAIRECIQK